MNINELMNDRLGIMNIVMNQTGALYKRGKTRMVHETSALPLASQYKHLKVPRTVAKIPTPLQRRKYHQSAP